MDLPGTPPLLRQRGAALLAAMLTVTLVATLAASALWQQWRDVEIETSERARVQAAWMLSGALDWSRLILREDYSANERSGKPTDNLSEPWAVPLQEARLSSFLAADQNNTASSTDDSDDVFLSGSITDAQALFNLRSLVKESEKKTIDPISLDILISLFKQLNLPESQAVLIANSMLAALVGDPANAPLLPQRLDEIAWFGVPPQTIQALAPYANILPQYTEVNFNTAPAPVLAAVMGSTASAAQKVVTARSNAPFTDVNRAFASAGIEVVSGVAAVKSDFFEVRGRLRLQQAVVEERSLVIRQGRVVQVVWRERGALPAPPPVTGSR